MQTMTVKPVAHDSNTHGTTKTGRQTWIGRLLFALVAVAMLVAGSNRASACTYLSSDPNISILGTTFNSSHVGVDFKFTGTHARWVEIIIDVGGSNVVYDYLLLYPESRVNKVWRNPYPHRVNACLKVKRDNAPAGVLERRHLTR